MRLLFVHDHVFQYGLDGAIYSPGRLPYAVWRRYLEVFDEIEVFARAAAAAHVESLSMSSGPAVRFNFEHGYSGPRSFVRHRGEVTQSLAAAIKRSDVVAARLPSELGLLAARIAPGLARTFAVEVVGCAFDAYWNHGSPAAKAYAPVVYARMRAAVRVAPFALYVTQRFLQRRYPTRGVTACVSNVELRGVGPEVLARRLEHISAHGSHVVLGFVGSLHSAYKGLETAMRALQQLQRAGRSMELRILGDGDQQPWRELAARLGLQLAVQFFGVLPGGPPVYRWIDDIDILIQPSKQEGLPRAVIEAMSRGCPVVGSTAGGIPELLPEDCLHSPGDWRGLASRLEEIAWDWEVLKHHAQRNWNESRKYDATVLDCRRHEFWQAVAHHARAAHGSN